MILGIFFLLVYEFSLLFLGTGMLVVSLFNYVSASIFWGYYFDLVMEWNQYIVQKLFFFNISSDVNKLILWTLECFLFSWCQFNKDHLIIILKLGILKCVSPKRFLGGVKFIKPPKKNFETRHKFKCQALYYAQVVSSIQRPPAKHFESTHWN